MTDRSAEIASRAKAMLPELIDLRRDIHRHPELGFEEYRTGRLASQELQRLGFEVRDGVAKTGVIARLKGAKPGRTIALRADMDALPIVDRKKVAYASAIDGCMHACGHDAHVAMALGAARVLADMRQELSGDVVILMQPAEEGPGGAMPMIEQGALDDVDYVIGQHMEPQLAAGEVGTCFGAMMAASDSFRVSIRGTGGHGAYPHLSVDPIPVAAQVIVALQQVVARRISPLASAVVTIGTIHGGYRFNVIADEVTFTGTVRTLDEGLRAELPALLEQIIAGTTQAFGATYTFEYENRYPVVINHEAAVQKLQQVAARTLGSTAVKHVLPSMAGEDFSYYLQRKPGVFYWLGCRQQNPQDAGYGLHHPSFDLDESALAVGVRLYVESAMDYLSPASPG